MDKREVAKYYRIDVPKGYKILVDRTWGHFHASGTVFVRSDGLATVAGTTYKSIDPKRIDICDQNWKTVQRGV